MTSLQGHIIVVVERTWITHWMILISNAVTPEMRQSTSVGMPSQAFGSTRVASPRWTVCQQITCSCPPLPSVSVSTTVSAETVYHTTCILLSVHHLGHLALLLFLIALHRVLLCGTWSLLHIYWGRPPSVIGQYLLTIVYDEKKRFDAQDIGTYAKPRKEYVGKHYVVFICLSINKSEGCSYTADQQVLRLLFRCVCQVWDLNVYCFAEYQWDKALYFRVNWCNIALLLAFDGLWFSAVRCLASRDPPHIRLSGVWTPKAPKMRKN